MRTLLPTLSLAAALAVTGCAVQAGSRPSPSSTAATYTSESPTSSPPIDSSVALVWSQSWWTAPTDRRVRVVHEWSTRALADTLARALPSPAQTPCRALRDVRDYTNTTVRGTVVVVTALCQRDRDGVAVALTLLLVGRDGRTLVEAVA